MLLELDLLDLLLRLGHRPGHEHLAGDSLGAQTRGSVEGLPR